jgi:hypothetical protein
MPDLQVQIRDRDIIVSKPSIGLSMTYRKAPNGPMLEALDPPSAASLVARSCPFWCALGKPHTKEPGRSAG